VFRNFFWMRPDTECKSFRRSLNDVRRRDHQNDYECSGLQRRMGSRKEFRRFCATDQFIFNNSSFSNQSRASDELVRFSGDSASAAATNNAGYYPVVAFQIRTSLDGIASGDCGMAAREGSDTEFFSRISCNAFRSYLPFAFSGNRRRTRRLRGSM